MSTTKRQALRGEWATPPPVTSFHYKPPSLLLLGNNNSGGSLGSNSNNNNNTLSPLPTTTVAAAAAALTATTNPSFLLDSIFTTTSSGITTFIGGPFIKQQQHHHQLHLSQKSSSSSNNHFYNHHEPLSATQPDPEPLPNPNNNININTDDESTTNPTTFVESITRVLRSLSLDDCGKLGLYVIPSYQHRDIDNGNCPERPNRIQKIIERLVEENIPTLQLMTPLTTSTSTSTTPSTSYYSATDDQLLRIHTRQYLKKLNKLIQQHHTTPKMSINLSAKDEFDSVFLTIHSIECAKHAAGACLQAVDAVLTSKIDSAACAIRPPGHHAESYCAMGYCLFNNAALAARKAVDEFGLKRVAIVDFDIHHGNGTQRLFWADERILYISIHRWDNGLFYPHRQFESCSKAIGMENTPAEGKTVNIAFQGNGLPMGNLEYRAAWTSIVEPILNQFNPELLIISAGFDAAQHDPIGGYCVTPKCFGEMTRRILIHPTTLTSNPMEYEKRKCILILEGGYNLQATADSFVECISAMVAPIDSSVWPSMESNIWKSSGESEWSKVRDEAIEAINSTIQAHENHWLLYPIEHCKKDGGKTVVKVGTT
jgi:acetoin utilization deacetylase AcuC-like enzyme